MSASRRCLQRLFALDHGLQCNGLKWTSVLRSMEVRCMNTSSTPPPGPTTSTSTSTNDNVENASEDDVYRPWGDQLSLGRAPPAPRIGPLRGIEPSERSEHQVGASLAAGGMSALAYHHADVLLTVENAGYSALFLGAATLLAARPNADPDAEGHVMGVDRGDRGNHMDVPQFRFVPLNIRRHNHIRSLKKLLQKDSSDHGTYVQLPSGVSSMLQEAQAKKTTQYTESVKQLEAAMHEDVQAALDAGVDPIRIHQHLLPRVYVLTFEDHVNRNVREKRKPTISRVEAFSAAVTLMLSAASPFDEVVVKITSPGGGVSEYGHLAAQLLRLRKAGIKTTVCVDTVAASGGYMAACVADKVVASPFAFLGSIGVVTGIPNVHKLMKKNDVDFLLMTAGKYKRTVHPLTEVTSDGVDKMQQQLEEIHDAFRDHVVDNRAQLDIDDVGTGEAWIAVRAKERGLVDELATSDEYICSKMQHNLVFEVQEAESKPKRGLQALFDRYNTSLQDALYNVGARVSSAFFRGATDVSALPHMESAHDNNLVSKTTLENTAISRFSALSDVATRFKS